MKPRRLRDVDAFPVREGGRTWLALRDGEGYAAELVLLSPAEAMAASRFDGRRTAEEIARELAGTDAERVRALAKSLDERLLLDSPRFQRAERAAKAAFRRAKSRPAWLAGRGYPGEPGPLAERLASWLPAAPKAPAGRPTGIVAPHIDFTRGGTGYGWAYGELLGSSLPALCVVIGVAHRTPPTPLVLARKDFETPFGTVPLDAALAKELQRGAPYDLRADEWVHRSEHSAEFQAVWLAYGRRRLGGELRLLPLLASSYDLDGADPGARTKAVLDRLAALLEPVKDSLLLVAGIDLAHVGPRFGDAEPVDSARMARVEAQDREALARLMEQDAEGWLKSVSADGNARRVCGVSAAYAFSYLHRALFPAARGTLLHWSHAADPAGGEVSFASAVFR